MYLSPKEEVNRCFLALNEFLYPKMMKQMESYIHLVSIGLETRGFYEMILKPISCLYFKSCINITTMHFQQGDTNLDFVLNVSRKL